MTRKNRLAPLSRVTFVNVRGLLNVASHRFIIWGRRKWGWGSRGGTAFGPPSGRRRQQNGRVTSASKVAGPLVGHSATRERTPHGHARRRTQIRALRHQSIRPRLTTTAPGVDHLLSRPIYGSRR